MSQQPVESALRILEVMRSRGVVAGQVAVRAWFIPHFNQYKWTSQDYNRGLAYADDQNWISIENAGTLIRLESKGEAVAWGS